jgi:Protein of unknown function (DUF3703)
VSLRDSAFKEAFAAARTCYGAGDLQTAFSLLERAHVLGQNRLGPHWTMHVWMLRVGWRRGDGREVAGQLLRLALTPLGHLTGRLPAGNTGGSNISPFATLPVPPDVQRLLGDTER